MASRAAGGILRMTALEHARAVALAVCALLAVAPAAAQDRGLRILVLEGEDNINIIEGGAAVPTRVEVRDGDGRPVSGATVLFLLGEGATATLNAGQQRVTLTTNAQGQAAVAVMPIASGAVELSVSAAFGGETATLTVVQSNYATVAEAVAAGVNAPGAPDGPDTGTDGGTAAGGGPGTGALVGIAAAGAAVAVGVAVGAGEDPAPPPAPPSPPPTTANPDRAVLMELYDATGGPTWINDTNWGSDAPLDQWHGVETNENGRVTFLHLEENRLTGSIPPSLGNLTGLVRLSFWNNALSGPIPPSLGSLANLELLHLGANALSGPIPSSLGSLANVVDLRLPDNALSGPIPPGLGDLANLEYLNLNVNDLSGPIPPSLGSLANLTSLWLVGNRLSGSIPTALCRFEATINPQQGDVSLPGCGTDGGEDRAVLMELYDATNGPGWRFNTNWGSGAPLDEWYGVTTDEDGRVAWLVLDSNGLTGSLPSSLGGLGSLKGMYFYDNELAGSIPSSLSALANLEGLGLGGNRLTGPVPSWLGGLSKLTILSLARNRLTGPVPPELRDLAKLEILALGGNELNGPIPPGLGGLTNLTALQLGSGRLSGPIPPSLGDLASLVYLELHDNELNGAIPPTLGDLANLNYLLLDGNDLSGSIPASLGNLPNLRPPDRRPNLRLHGNRLSGSIPAALCRYEAFINPQQGNVNLPCEGSGATAMEVRLVAGDGRLQVSWTASEGGGTVDDYDVRYRVDTEPGAWSELPDATKSTATSATIGGLRNGTVYEVQVRAGTAEGDGPWSETVTGAPAAPTEGLSFGDARIEDQRFGQHAPIAPEELPAATGGVGAVTYTLSPALPAGLTFDAASRTIGGTPTATTAPATYTYTATDSAASSAQASLSFTLEVKASADEAALRRDGLAAQGRALLSSVTGVIGGRFRPRPRPPAAGGGRTHGATESLVRAVASMLGLGMGSGRGGASGGAGFMTGLPAAGDARLAAPGRGGHPAAAVPGPGSHPTLGAARLGGLSRAGSLDGRWALGSGGFGGAMPAGFAAGRGGLPPVGSPGFGEGPGGLRPGAFGRSPGGWDGLPWNRSFAAPLGAGGEAGGPSRYTVWGAGDRQSFSGSPAAGRYRGDLRSLYAGADSRLGADWLAGAAVGWSRGAADYSASVAGATAGRLATRLTSVHPYLQGRVSQGLELWAIGGYGRGEAVDARGAEAAGEPGRLTMRMGAAGLRQEMLRRGGVALSLVGGAGSLALSTSGGGLTVSGLGAAVHRGRLAVEASRASGAVSPFAQVGGRYDGGDGQTGTGLEVVGGLRASAPRVELEARGRWLSAHSASGYEEYGASVRLALKSRPDGTGARALLSPRWGMADALSPGEGGLLGGGGVAGLPRGAGWTPPRQALSLDGEVGYGWRTRRFRGVLSPLTSYRRTSFGGGLMQVGVSYQSLQDLLGGDVRMQFTLGREQWLGQGAGYQAALTVLSVF